MAGGPSFQRTRGSLRRRVVDLFPELPEVARMQEGRAWRLWDEVGARRLGPAWGHVYRDEMVRLKRAAEAHTMTLSYAVFFYVRSNAIFRKLHSHCEGGSTAAALAATRTVNVDWFTIASSASARIIVGYAQHP